MKENQNHKSESGQIVILLALAFVGILAFAALAIDGAMIYSDRRIAQNGADAASISGGQAVADDLVALGDTVTYLNWDCGVIDDLGVLATGDSAAITHAGIVDFTIDNDISDVNGVRTECFNIFNGTYYETFIDVFVQITNETPTSFLHLIFGDTVNNEVEVKTRVYPLTEAGYGMTLLSLYDPGYCDKGVGLELKGGPNIDIQVGGIVSNSYMKISGTGDITVGDGIISYKYEDENCYEELGGPTVSPSPNEGPGIPDPDIDPPDCSGLSPDDYPKKEADGPMDPGIYSKNNQVINFDLEMNPGLYCIDGNLTIHSDVLNAPNVTLYMRSGDLTINAGSALTLTAPTTDTVSLPPIGEYCAAPGSGCQGILVYVPHGNEGVIKINGNSSSLLDGSIYAPDSAVNINGNSQVGDEPDTVVYFGVQVIADTIYVGGTANIEFIYPGSGIPLEGITLEVAK